MGTFDEFHLLDPKEGEVAFLVKCTEGHFPQGGVQTKDLDCTMSHFYVFGDHVYEGAGFLGRKESEPRTTQAYAVKDGELIITSTERLSPRQTMDGAVTVYTSCNQCTPVVCETTHNTWDRVQLLQPWCQWTLWFEKGKLVKVEPDRVESRADLVKKARETGLNPLPDDDRIAKRELAKWREGNPLSAFG